MIGELRSESGNAELLLLDFALFKRSVLKEIGPADECFDWYGRGADMSIRCALLGVKMSPLFGVQLEHSLESENRTPPHYAFDFFYLNQKWSHLEKRGGSVYLDLDGPKVSHVMVMYAKYLWPVVRSSRNFIKGLGN